MYVNTYVYICKCKYIMCVCLYVFIYAYLYLYLHLYSYLCIYVFMYLYTYIYIPQLHLNITDCLNIRTTSWYFRLPPGRFLFGRPVNVRNPIHLAMQLNIRMELIFHTTSRALWSDPPSTYLIVVTV